MTNKERDWEQGKVLDLVMANKIDLMGYNGAIDKNMGDRFKPQDPKNTRAKKTKKSKVL